MGSQVVSSVKWAWKQQEQKSSSLTTQSNDDGIWRVLNYSCRQLRPSQLGPTGWPALKPNKCKYPTVREGETGREGDALTGSMRYICRYCCCCSCFLCMYVWLGKQKSWLVWPARQSVSHSVSQKPKSATKLKSMHGQLHLADPQTALPTPHSPRFAPPPLPLGLHLPLCNIGSCHCSLLMFMAHFAILRLSFTKLVRLQLWEEHRGRTGGGRGNWQSVLQAVKNEAYAERRNNNSNNNNGSNSKSIDQHTEIIARRKANLKWKLRKALFAYKESAANSKGSGQGKSVEIVENCMT